MVALSIDMDVFLQTLIEVLKELSKERVKIRDEANSSIFKICARLLWKINDLFSTI